MEWLLAVAAAPIVALLILVAFSVWLVVRVVKKPEDLQYVAQVIRSFVDLFRRRRGRGGGP